jgi:hypothetical protein
MTRTPSSCSKTLLTLICGSALFFAAPKLHAQDCAGDLEEMSAAIDELEQIGNEIANQRDKAIAIAERNRTERDRCLGSAEHMSALTAALQVKVADYERILARYEARPRWWVPYAAGVATPIVLSGLGILLYLVAVR